MRIRIGYAHPDRLLSYPDVRYLLYDIIERIGVQKYRNTVKSMEYLTLEELRTICAQVGNMRLVEH